MRTIIIIKLLFLVSFVTVGQDHVNKKEMVGFGCYFGGTSTKAVNKMTRLIESKQYSQISKRLTSKNSGEKYLAVIILERLVNNGQYEVTDNEMELISRTKQSEELVSVCSGCTYFDNVPMKELFMENNIIGSSFWLDRTITK